MDGLRGGNRNTLPNPSITGKAAFDLILIGEKYKVERLHFYGALTLRRDLSYNKLGVVQPNRKDFQGRVKFPIGGKA